MKDVLKNAQELRRFYDYYRVQLNGNRNPVFVTSGDVSLIQRHLDLLHQKTHFISPTMSAELADIRQYLFVAQGPGIYIFNISKPAPEGSKRSAFIILMIKRNDEVNKIL